MAPCASARPMAQLPSQKSLPKAANSTMRAFLPQPRKAVVSMLLNKGNSVASINMTPHGTIGSHTKANDFSEKYMTSRKRRAPVTMSALDSSKSNNFSNGFVSNIAGIMGSGPFNSKPEPMGQAPRATPSMGMSVELERNAQKSAPKTTTSFIADSDAIKAVIEGEDKSGSSFTVAKNESSGPIDEEHMTKSVEDPGMLKKLGELNEKRKVKNVLKYYNELFVKSEILERIIPRKVNGPEELRDFNQYILKHPSDYEQSDIDAVNEVSCSIF